jgi:hypothetical protein
MPSGSLCWLGPANTAIARYHETLSLCLDSLHLVPEMPLPCRGGLEFVSAGNRSYCTIKVRDVDPASLPELACTITV